MGGKSGAGGNVISLPKGGGAVRGVGETFSADPFTGTGRFTVPIAVPPGRGGFEPKLALVYDAGSGNGPFGLGWSLSVPSVARKTAKGIPVYDDDEDVFLLSGAEDLVFIGDEGEARRYRPRTEGLFARILHRKDAPGDRWEVSTRDGLVSTYGTAGAVLAHPDHPQRILAWKLAHTVDPFGNRIEYTYQVDATGAGGPTGPGAERVSEAVTASERSFAQIYLAEVRYVDHGPVSARKFLVRVCFRYEDRPDPFSDHRGGFDVRTRRRCRRIEVLTQHHQSTLVRTYHLEYLDDTGRGPMNGASILSRIRVEGAGHGEVAAQSLPPLSFSYTDFKPGEQRFIPVTGPALPTESLAHPDYDLVDMSGGGLPDILQLNGVASRWWKNLGGGKFDLPRSLGEAPAGIALGEPGVQIIDADGDGRADLMITRAELSGYFPMAYGGRWDRRSFRRFGLAPSFDLRDPEVKFVDLDGDGVTDAVRSGSTFECFFNDPKHGWVRPRHVARKGLAEFPDVTFSDPRVKWADMTGDGLTDIVLVHRGSIEYWPNRGRGDWGPRVVMAGAPRLPDGYDPRRVLLGDVDGDGVADLVLVEDGRVTVWINRSGNGWSDPVVITGTPRVTDADAVRLTDLLGNGVAGILWSADARSSGGRPWMFFLDLTGGTKPYLMNELDGGMGAVTKVAYAPSTRFFLEDEERPETRWKSPLPFPLQVVARVEVIDAISRGKLTTEYRYHHGYWDGVERELRGFGRVDHRDTEVFADYHAPGLHGDAAPFDPVPDTPEQPFFSPPTETRTWFHQGPVGDRGSWVENDLSAEYWTGDGTQLADFAQRGPRSRSAVRALRGRVLRSELYVLDGSDLEKRPFTVTESVAGVRPVDGAPGVFFPYPIAERATQWERGDDPLTRFSFTEDFDEYGQPRRAIAIAVPRSKPPSVTEPGSPPPAPEPYLATLALTTFAAPEGGGRYIVDRVSSVTSYEIVHDGAGSVADLYRKIQDGTASLRVIGQSFHHYDGAAFTGLPCGKVGAHGALMRTESLVLTREILERVHPGGAIPPYLATGGPVAWTEEYPQGFRNLPALAGHVFHPGGDASERCPAHVLGYFVQTERRKYDFQHQPQKRGHGLVQVTRDPMGRESFVDYDQYRVLPTLARDPAGLETRADPDYRVLQPACITDANGNTTRICYSPLGLVEGIIGPKDHPEKPGTRFVHDLTPYSVGGKPLSVRTIQHVHPTGDTTLPEAERDDTIERIELSDGFGRVVQVRVQAEDVAFGDPAYGGGLLPADMNDAGQQPIVGRPGDPARPRVVVSGAQTYDNKGRVVEKFEPVFSEGWAYEPPDTLPRGQKVTFFHDALGRPVRTVFPDGSEQRVVHGIPHNLEDPTRFSPTPWEAYTYDPNDNAGRTHGDDAAAKRYLKHWNTPATAVMDALGRSVLALQRDGAGIEDWLFTRATHDIQGNVLAVTDPKGRVAFRHVYDLAGHALRTESIDAGWQRQTLDAAGAVIEHRDEKGAIVLSAHDKAGRPSRTWARDGDAPGEKMTLRELRFYGDDAVGVGLSDARAKGLNLLGRLYRTYDEAGEETFAEYDHQGHVTEKWRRVIADAVILKALSAMSPTGEVKAFRVDWQWRTTLLQHAETLLEDVKHETSMRYDALGRVRLLRYPRDKDGVRKEAVPTYNRAGGLESVTMVRPGKQPNAPPERQAFVRRIVYDAKGRRAMIAYGNGVMTRHAYDPRTFRLVRLRTERYKEEPALTYLPRTGQLQDLGYEYDLAGNIVRIDDRTPEAVGGPGRLVREFGYDPLYRLEDATGREADVPLAPAPWKERETYDVTRTRPYEEHYRYDKAGNLESIRGLPGVPVRKMEFLPGTNRLSLVKVGAAEYRYSYDRCGNLIQENGSRRFEWDHGDRMRVFQDRTDSAKPTVHVHYLYDSGGQRVKKLVWKGGAPVETAVYIDGVFERRTEGTKASDTLHVMDGQQRIALVRAGQALSKEEEEIPAVRYQLGDHLGSVNVEVDGGGAWMKREEHTPYGETSYGGYRRKRYRFTGKEREGESGLYYHGARYYAPWVGRWVSPDPAGGVDGPNLYLYARCSPLMVRDPSGLEGEAPPTGSLLRDIEAHQCKVGQQLPEPPGLRHLLPGGAQEQPSIRAAGGTPSFREDLNKYERWRKEAEQIRYRRALEATRAAIAEDNFGNYERGKYLWAARMFVPFVNTAVHAIKGEWERAAESAFWDAVGLIASRALGPAGSSAGRGGGEAAGATRSSSAAARARDLAATKPIGESPPDLPLDRNVGRTSRQNSVARTIAYSMKEEGWQRVRLNQTQIDARGTQVGVNRPDIGGTPPGGRRHNLELEKPGSGRGERHLDRLNTNDPASVNFWMRVPGAMFNTLFGFKGTIH